MSCHCHDMSSSSDQSVSLFIAESTTPLWTGTIQTVSLSTRSEEPLMHSMNRGKLNHTRNCLFAPRSVRGQERQKERKLNRRARRETPLEMFLRYLSLSLFVFLSSALSLSLSLLFLSCPPEMTSVKIAFLSWYQGISWVLRSCKKNAFKKQLNNCALT